MQQERPIDADEEARLDALVRRLHTGARVGDPDDVLVDAVAALRTQDRVSAEALERHVDALYETHADTARRRSLVDHFATRFERSTLFKVLAASVLAHLLALPVVALVLLTPEPRRMPNIGFEPIDRSPSPIAEEPRDDLDLSDAFNAVLLLDREIFAKWAPLLADLGPRPTFEKRIENVLWTRLATIAGSASESELSAHLEHPADAVGAPADEVAVLELALDVYVLRPALRAAALEVVRVLAPRVGGASAARAAAYGVFEGAAGSYEGVDPAAFVRATARLGAVDAELVRQFERLAQD